MFPEKHFSRWFLHPRRNSGGNLRTRISSRAWNN